MEKFKDLVVESGAFNANRSAKGKWNMNAIKEFLKSTHKANTEITVSLKKFYDNFYNGGKVIKYIGYYSRTHTLECMKALDIEGYCHQIKLDSGEVLKIGFKN
jgi:hypothetical protein